MARLVQDAPIAQPPSAGGIFGSIVINGDVAYGLLVVHDTDPPTVMRRVRIEALVGDDWVPCELVSVGGGGGAEGPNALAISWHANPLASKYACTY
jgi:hypothetical protein